MTKEELLDRINDILVKKGWSMNKLARESGIPAPTIYNISKRKSMPELQTVWRIAMTLGVSMDSLLGGEKSDYSVYIDKEFYDIFIELDTNERLALKQMAKTISELKHRLKK